MRKSLIIEAVLVCAVCAACGGMAAVSIYLGHTTGVAPWLALGVSTALHLKRNRDALRTHTTTLRLLEECAAEMQAELARHKDDLEAAYREALERHEREGRAVQ